MIPLNEEQARSFLAKNGIDSCTIKQIAGDASFRSYYRIFCDNGNLVLMFAPPGFEDIRPFAKIDEFLVANGFSAPKIFARDENLGFLLLEDLDDDTYGRVLAKDNSLELPLYQKACDVLLALHKLPLSLEVPNYNNALLFREVMLLVDWYLALQKKVMSVEEKADFKFLWFQLFDLIDRENQVLVLRDYHADNLMIVKERVGAASVGLLDFQDAVIGSKAYDLVSLLEDARRDLDQNNRQKLLQYYLKNSGCNEKSFIQDYEILSLQRNIKIIGIFSRLSLRDGKHAYLNMIPRVLAFVNSRLESESVIFSDIKKLLKKFL